MIKPESGSHHRTGLFLLLKMFTGLSLISFAVSDGMAQRASFRHDGLLRTFHMHSPSAIDRPAMLPLLVALHGRGGTGESLLIVTRKGFDRLADSEGFIVVYPDGIELNWNDGRMDEEANDRAHRENIDDVGFISALIDFMIKNYGIDPARVYVTGISNGAIMAYRLACELSHKITAIAPVDGNIPQLLFHDCYPAMPVSVLAINNVNDPLVPYEGGSIYTSIRRLNLGKVLSTDQSVGFWVNRNKCSDIPIITEEPDLDPGDGTRVTRKEYTDCASGTGVVLYSIDGGGHTWPGGIQYLPEWIVGKTCRDIDACTVIWSFFSKYPATIR